MLLCMRQRVVAKTTSKIAVIASWIVFPEKYFVHAWTQASTYTFSPVFFFFSPQAHFLKESMLFFFFLLLEIMVSY